MNDAVKFISQYRTFVLAAHINPEGDAIGSALGLARILVDLGKTAAAYTRDPVPKAVSFLPGAETAIRDVAALPPAEAVIVLDCGDLERAGKEFAGQIRGRPTLNLDHHRTNTRFGQANWVDPEASSTGEMITLLAQAMKLRISPAAATCLYTAILTDTGSFQFSNTTPRALRAAADLIEAGASAAAVADYYYHSKPASHLLLLAQTLSTLDFNPDFSRGEAELSLDMFKKARAGSDASEGIINWINDVETVKVSILYRQAGDRPLRRRRPQKRRGLHGGGGPSRSETDHPGASGPPACH